MRVLLLNYEYPPFGGSDGIACQALARGLAARGATVDVVTSGDFDGRTQEPFRDADSGEDGLLTVHRVKCRRAQIQPSGVRDVLGFLRATRAAGPPTPSQRALRSGSPVLLARDRARCCPSSVSGACLSSFRIGPPSPSRGLFRGLTRWIWRRADRVVAVSESLANEIRRASPTLRYAVIPDGVDLTRFRPTLRRRPSARLRCLAVARLVEREGLGDLIRAIGLLERERCELEIVGAGPDELSLRQLAAGLGIFGPGLLQRDARPRHPRQALPRGGHLHAGVVGGALRRRVRPGAGVRAPDRGHQRRGDPRDGGARRERTAGASTRSSRACLRHPPSRRPPGAARTDGPAEPGAMPRPGSRGSGS